MGGPENKAKKALFKNTPPASGEELFAAEGPFRPVRDGESVLETDVFDELGIPMVPQRKYGGRRNKGMTLPPGVPFDRRQPQTTTDKLQTH